MQLKIKHGIDVADRILSAIVSSIESAGVFIALQPDHQHTDDRIDRKPKFRAGELSSKPTSISPSSEGLVHVGFFIARMTLHLETTVQRFLTTPTTSTIDSELLAVDSHVDATREPAATVQAVTEKVEDFSPEINAPGSSLPGPTSQNELMNVEPTAPPRGADLDELTHYFVRENPW